MTSTTFNLWLALYKFFVSECVVTLHLRYHVIAVINNIGIMVSSIIIDHDDFVVLLKNDHTNIVRIETNKLN